jgi:transcriptional regulator with XRE-family HTH domain
MLACANSPRYSSAMEQGQEPLNPTQLVGERVAKVRNSQGMTQDALAEAMREAGVDMERVVIAKLEKGLRPFIKLDELLALCLVLNVAPIDLLVAADLDDDQQYAVTPTITAKVSTVRDWIRGETFMLLTYKGEATGLYSPKGRPTAAEIARVIQWMPDDRGREVMQRWLEEEQQEQGKEDRA